MNINVKNCYETLDNSMDKINEVLEPLQKDNYDVRLALTNARLMHVTAKNILDEYNNLKNSK